MSQMAPQHFLVGRARTHIYHIISILSYICPRTSSLSTHTQKNTNGQACPLCLYLRRNGQSYTKTLTQFMTPNTHHMCVDITNNTRVYDDNSEQKFDILKKKLVSAVHQYITRTTASNKPHPRILSGARTYYLQVCRG